MFKELSRLQQGSGPEIVPPLALPAPITPRVEEVQDFGPSVSLKTRPAEADLVARVRKQLPKDYEWHVQEQNTSHRMYVRKVGNVLELRTDSKIDPNGEWTPANTQSDTLRFTEDRGALSMSGTTTHRGRSRALTTEELERIRDGDGVRPSPVATDRLTFLLNGSVRPVAYAVVLDPKSREAELCRDVERRIPPIGGVWYQSQNDNHRQEVESRASSKQSILVLKSESKIDPQGPWSESNTESHTLTFTRDRATGLLRVEGILTVRGDSRPLTSEEVQALLQKDRKSGLNVVEQRLDWVLNGDLADRQGQSLPRGLTFPSR